MLRNNRHVSWLSSRGCGCFASLSWSTVLCPRMSSASAGSASKTIKVQVYDWHEHERLKMRVYWYTKYMHRSQWSMSQHHHKLGYPRLGNLQLKTSLQDGMSSSTSRSYKTLGHQAWVASGSAVEVIRSTHINTMAHAHVL